jgi:hypothetical protein
MHGYGSFAEYQTADTMAGSPGKVMELLEDVWGRAKGAAERERKALEEYTAAPSAEEGGAEKGAAAAAALEGGIQPWDWRYYAEKVGGGCGGCGGCGASWAGGSNPAGLKVDRFLSEQGGVWCVVAPGSGPMGGWI